MVVLDLGTVPSYVNDQNWSNGIEANADGYFVTQFTWHIDWSVDQIPTGYNTSVYWGCLWKSMTEEYFTVDTSRPMTHPW